MPTVKIVKLNKSREQKFIQFEIEQSLKTVLRKYDKNLNPRNTNVSIGNESFADWKLSMDECLFYGEVVFVFTYNLILNVRYVDKTEQLLVDKRENFKSLKIRTKHMFNFKTIPILYHENELISDIKKSIESTNLIDGSIIEITREKRFLNVLKAFYSNKISIKIKINNSIAFVLSVNPSDYIFSLFENIEYIYGRSLLMFNDSIIDNENTFEH